MNNPIEIIVEVTDTYQGEANYNWAKRANFFTTTGNKVRAAKKKMGWTGLRCKKQDCGEMIILRPQGLCQIMFIRNQPV